jgi:catechol 2,3-dioxygenase
MVRLPETISLGQVGLAVADLERSIGFYTDALGLDLLQSGTDEALLGSGERPLLRLEARPNGGRDPAEAGLFHVALLLPDRPALGRLLRHLNARGISLDGASDHGVSEALYLADPEGNGIELYRDRPREAWYVNGRFNLTTQPLDLRDLASSAGSAAFAGMPEGTVVGHVHLETHDLAAATGFYRGELGFSVMAEVPGAFFLSKGGYHHHVAVNVWRRRSRPRAASGDRLGLTYYEIVGTGHEGEELVDPSGIRLLLR